jgi:DNA repair exonuclease SbcCD nuclease subunit
MTRVAIIADSHFDETSRFDECRRLHDWIADDLCERGVALILHAGDVFERRSTPRERLAFAEWLQRAASLAPVAAVRGNHDAPGDLLLFRDLETRHPVHVVEDARVVEIAGCAIACVAWPRKAHLLALLEQAGREAGELAAADALRNVLRGLGHQLAKHEGPRILLMHAMVRGSRVSTGQPLVGCDLELGLEDLRLVDADFVALGHIHLGQDWTVDGAPCVYPGSPRRTAFGEGEPKGYVLVDFDEIDGSRRPTEDWPRWERIEVPATPMVMVESAWRDGALLGLEHTSVAGAEVRLRFETPVDHREAARAQALEQRDRLLAAGAIAVKVEEIVTVESRARAPEVATAQTLEEKLSALWRARSFEPGARRERLVDKANQVEMEAR